MVARDSSKALMPPQTYHIAALASDHPDWCWCIFQGICAASSWGEVGSRFPGFIDVQCLVSMGLEL